MGDLVSPLRIIEAATARGRVGGRPRKVDIATLKMAAAAMSDPKSIASEVAKRLNITTATLYTYVNSDGSLKPAGIKLVETGAHSCPSSGKTKK